MIQIFDAFNQINAKLELLLYRFLAKKLYHSNLGFVREQLLHELHDLIQELMITPCKQAKTLILKMLGDCRRVEAHCEMNNRHQSQVRAFQQAIGN